MPPETYVHVNIPCIPHGYRRIVAKLRKCRLPLEEVGCYCKPKIDLKDRQFVICVK